MYILKKKQYIKPQIFYLTNRLIHGFTIQSLCLTLVLVLCLFYSENKSIENKYSWAQFIQITFADTYNNSKISNMILYHS